MGGSQGHRSGRRSIVSIEKAIGKAGSKGSITIGKGTTRRAGGAGVEAVGVTALGFFTPPEEQTTSNANTGADNDAIDPAMDGMVEGQDGKSSKSKASVRATQLSEVAE